MIELKVSGMTCGGCVTSVTKAIQRVYPGAAVEVELATGRVRTVVPAESLDALSRERIAKAIVSAGFVVEAQ